jgi:hypothetical protein
MTGDNNRVGCMVPWPARCQIQGLVDIIRKDIISFSKNHAINYSLYLCAHQFCLNNLVII